MYNGLGFSVYLSTFPRQRDGGMGKNRRSRFPLPAHQRGIRAGLLPTGRSSLPVAL